MDKENVIHTEGYHSAIKEGILAICESLEMDLNGS